MARILILLYGVGCYGYFFAVFLYLFGFVGDLWVPKSVSMGGNTEGGLAAVLINLGLIALFGVQHSVMARPSFKKWWAKIIPPAMERSTFVLVTNVILTMTYAWWRPMSTEIWNFQGSAVGTFLWVVFATGALVVLASSFMINHFDLFGLRQVWLHFQGKPYTALPFRVTGLYKWVRNPLMLGFLMAFWAAAVMTTGRLLYAAGMTLYIFIGIYFEERNIAEHLGDPYHDYKKKTSMLFPAPRKKVVRH